MKITASARKAINAKARQVVGWLDHCEVGSRICICEYSNYRHSKIDPAQHVNPEREYFNLVLLDGHETDLCDMMWLRDLKAVEDAPGGNAKIDIWVYQKSSFYAGDYQLFTTLTATFERGRLISVTV